MHKSGRLLRATWRLVMLSSMMGGLLSLQGQIVNSDFYVATGGSTLTVSAPGVLGNDTSVTGYSAVLVAGPAHGTLTLAGDGSFIYTSTNSYSGVDGFTYQAKKRGHASHIASVDIMVLAPGEVFYDDFSRPAAGGAIFPWVQRSSAQVVGSSAGITNRQFIEVGAKTNYSIAYYPDGDWTDYSVQAQFRFSADNAASAGIMGRLNTGSGAHYGAWIYSEHSPETLGSGNGTALLRLIKYETWTYPWTLVGNPVVLSGAGTDWHTLKMTFQGTNIFTYYDGNLVISATDDGSIDGSAAFYDGGIGLNMWTLPSPVYSFFLDNFIVTTNDACVANYDAYVAVSNLTLHVAAPGILANDTGNGPLTALLVSGPANGTLSLTNTGGFTYTPAGSFIGTDQFTYQCTDGQTTSSVTTVTITVSNAAIASDDFYAVLANTQLKVKAPGVLANDQGGQKPLKALLATRPTDGKLSFSKNGSFNYTPNKNFTGLDSFTYVATDGKTTSSVATVRLKVTTGLLASNDFYNTESDTSLSVPAPGVLLNDFTAGLNVTPTVISRPKHGNLTWGGDGSFTYTLTNNFTGIDGFTYRDTSGSISSGTGSVDIMVLGSGELFDDDFTRPTNNGSIFPWTQVSGTFSAGTQGVSDVGGTWGITNGLMIGTGTNYTYGYAYCGDTNWTDYSIQGQFKFSKNYAASAGLVGRLNPLTGAHYAVWIYPENSDEYNIPPVGGIPRLWLYKYSSWTAYTSIGQWSSLPAVGTSWHSLKLTFQGTNISAYFDGGLAASATDDGTIDGTPAYPNGSLGLNLWISTLPYTFSVSNVIATVSATPAVQIVNSPTAITSPMSNLRAQGITTNNGGSAPVTKLKLSATTITVPVILSIGLTNQIITITWNSVAGASYGLQSTTNYLNGGWSTIYSNLTASGSTLSQTDVLSDVPLQFYRVILLPQPKF